MTATATEDPPMAKKKGRQPKPPGRPSMGDEAKRGRYAFRASFAWLAWLEEFGRHERKDKAILAREAFEALARARGFRSPPKDEE